jgi:8-oxo-dGTP diphosphatase
LPGGFVNTDESLQQAVNRELMEETKIKVNYLEQLCTFGDDIHRDPRQRVISIAYIALVNAQLLEPIANTDAANAAWFSFNKLPPLAYDHSLIIKKWIERLKSKLQYQPIGY